MKLLVIDTSYNYEAIKKKNLYEAIYSRDLKGYFKKVWSVHPFASITTSRDQVSDFGKIEKFKINENHYFIEGKIGKFYLLRKFKILNFILSQIEIFIFLRKLIREENIDFIKAHDPHYNSLIAYFLSFLTKTPFLVRVSGNFEKIYNDTRKPIVKRLFIFRSIEKIFEKFIFKKADFVIAPNLDNLNYAFSYGLSKEKGAVVRYGSLIHKEHLTDPILRKDKFFFKKELNFDDNSFYVIYVGRLEKVKRVMNLIKIMQELDNKDIKLLIIGNGSLKKDIQLGIVSKNLSDRVFLLGEKDQNWLARCLPNCSCFFATHTGRALAEASFAGLPSVGYDIDWHSEIIEHGKSGFLVKLDDHKSFADYVIKIINDKELSKKLSTNIRLNAVKLLSPNKIHEIEIECFKKLKNSKR